jgi:hypothetical protein
MSSPCDPELGEVPPTETSGPGDQSGPERSEVPSDATCLICGVNEGGLQRRACSCKGSVAFAHPECALLHLVFGEAVRASCELCRSKYPDELIQKAREHVASRNGGTASEVRLIDQDTHRSQTSPFKSDMAMISMCLFYLFVAFQLTSSCMFLAFASVLTVVGLIASEPRIVVRKVAIALGTMSLQILYGLYLLVVVPEGEEKCDADCVSAYGGIECMTGVMGVMLMCCNPRIRDVMVPVQTVVVLRDGVALQIDTVTNPLGTTRPRVPTAGSDTQTA